jgi:rod shape-determining protein MreB and related proteins
VRVIGILRPPLVAIDVGTATTRLCWGPGEVHERPSVTSEEVHGRTIVRRVMRDGVVADIEGVAGVVGTLLATRRRAWPRRPAAVVSVPTDASVQDREALVEAIAAGGASVAAVVPEPLAAAIGAGLDVSSEYATPILDVGDGVTDFAIFRNGSMVFSDAKRIGCGTLRAAIHDWLELQQHAGVTLGEETVEEVVRAYCRPVSPPPPPLPVGREDLEALLDPVLDAIASFVATTLRNLPDTLAAEVIESGLHVTGGGAKLQRLLRCIEDRSGLPVLCPAEPRNAVIRGATEMLRNAKLLDAQRAIGCYGAV